jgi:hypothetical protein
MMQVTKVWWDGEKLMAEPIDPATMYKDPVDSLLDEAKVLADDRPVEVGHLPQWTLDAEHMIRRLVKAFNSTPQPARQEPFGYFKAEPFGWTDCAETDEGAIALYEQPVIPQGWKLVPYDPSIDMQEQGSTASGYDLSQARAKRVYQAMIDMHDVVMEREPTDQFLRLQAGYPEQPQQDMLKLGCINHDCERCQTQHPRTWVGLTPEDKQRILANDFGGNRLDCMDAAERILKEKNQ